MGLEFREEQALLRLKHSHFDAVEARMSATEAVKMREEVSGFS